MGDLRESRRAIRRSRRKRERQDRKTRAKVERQLTADGVLGRVEALKAAVVTPGVAEAIEEARREYETLRGPIRDFNVLRDVVSTSLSAQGFDVRGVMLKFAWDPAAKKLQIFITSAVDAVEAAARSLGLDPETAFRSMIDRR